VLEECLPYVDYVALDVKTSLEKYQRLGAKEVTGFLRTLEVLKTGKVEYELRTTIVPGFVDAEDLARIGELVKGARTFALQQFVPGDTLDKSFSALKPYAQETIAKYAERMENYASIMVLRA
jgi:pyruvate formate lyase activating enzyme